MTPSLVPRPRRAAPPTGRHTGQVGDADISSPRTCRSRPGCQRRLPSVAPPDNPPPRNHERTARTARNRHPHHPPRRRQDPHVATRRPLRPLPVAHAFGQARQGRAPERRRFPWSCMRRPTSPSIPLTFDSYTSCTTSRTRNRADRLLFRTTEWEGVPRNQEPEMPRSRMVQRVRAARRHHRVPRSRPARLPERQRSP